jgi:trehalose 6-phosphate synthase
VDQDNSLPVPPEKPAYTLRRLWLNDKEIDQYYFGLSNRVLWPLFHMSISNMFYREKHWQEYCKVNEKFAKATMKSSKGHAKNTLVWLHDFHLTLAAKSIKSKMPDLTSGFFWHIPWPVWAIYEIFPRRRELLEGILANDLVGFHTRRYVKNFLNCVKYALHADVNYKNQTVTYQGHKTQIKHYPISIDYARINKMSRSIDTAPYLEKMKLKDIVKDKIVLLGVDRMDYSKGIYEKLLAIDHFLEKYPQYQGKLVFIQKSSLSRTKLKTYRQYKYEVGQLINYINQKYERKDWQPIYHITDPYDLHRMVTLYKVADMCVVNSLMDGMNLVSKEFIAAKTNGLGVLVCSKYAGVVSELQDYLLSTDPRDIMDIADKIYEGLQVSPSKQKRYMRKMRHYLKEHDIFSWAKDNLAAMVDIISKKE